MCTTEPVHTVMHTLTPANVATVRTKKERPPRCNGNGPRPKYLLIVYQVSLRKSSA